LLQNKFSCWALVCQSFISNLRIFIASNVNSS
jgi:hypothetical protein